jgi:uncharacterized membrane protein
MELGPLQLMVIGFDKPDFQGDIAEEIVRLSDAGVVRLIDAIVVDKDREGNTTTIQTTDLTRPEMEEFGITVGALIGLGLAGEEGVEAGAVVGAEAVADGHLLDDLDLVDVLDEIEPDSAAAIVLLEHTWAIPLREAIVRANGVPVIDMWIHPDELIALGAMAAD